MKGDGGAALLIDADNLSSAEVLEEALAELKHRGLRVPVIRAYGSAQTLQNIREFLQRHAARVVVNYGPGTTDAALVVDAMDLLHAGQLPGVVAVGSSDGDFAPLAVRLRESGREVLCYALAEKAAIEDLRRVYAQVVLVGAKRATAAPRPAAAAPPAPAPARQPARKPAAKKAPARSTAARKAAPATSAPDVASGVLAVLQEFQGLADGESIPLGPVIEKLRKEKLMSRSASAGAFFKRVGVEVALTPERQPNKLRLLRP